ncbi:MAG TPA: hypothetical protein VLJ62_12065 [Burkholderiaceae bacterium]|nr:hypothetical protein [Burkholderiaceae bacterium]
MSHSTNQRIRALCRASSALALAGAASIGPAHATDWKGYAGVNCLAQTNNHAVRRSAVNHAALANTGTSMITVFCPVVRDVAEGGNNRVIAVRVLMRNRNSSVAGRCEFSSHNINGIKIDSRSAVVPPNSFDPVDLGPVDAHNWGSYVLSCQLPGRDAATNLQSYIVNYRVDEAL